MVKSNVLKDCCHTKQWFNQINLQAAKNTASQTSSNSSSSGSIGLSLGASTGVTLSASKARGNADGADISYTNTQVNAGNTVSLRSGGDTTLKGAVVAGNTIKADVGGNLAIESLQDTSTYTSRQSSSGGSISFGGGKLTGGGISVGRSNIDSNFASVNQQSGIQAGDRGFQVGVNNNTDLKGSVIASTQTAIDQNRNSFTTGGNLSTSDIQNSASYTGQAVGISVDVGQQAGKFGVNGVGVGLGSDKGNASSTTTAGISAIAGNTSVRTGDAQTGIAKIFDAAKVQSEIDAQVTITQAFSKEAPKAVATFAANQIKDLQITLAKTQDPATRTQLQAEIDKWKEGGMYRVALHTLSGAFGGGASGALGAATVASAANVMNDFQDSIQKGLESAGLSPDTAKAFAQGVATLTAAGMGAAVGGTQGAATSVTVDVNNRQLHPTEIQWIKANAKLYAQQQNISEADAEKQLAAQAFRQVQFGAAGQTDITAQAFLKTAGSQLLPGDPNIPGQTVGFMFWADPVQKINPWMYADTIATNADFYIKNGIKLPSAEAIASAAMSDAQSRENLKNLTKGAAVLSAVATVAGMTPTLLTWVLLNPDKAVQTGIITAETAAGIASGAFVPSSLPKFASLSNEEARRWYLTAEANMLSQIDKNVPLEIQAYQMWNLRNYYRTATRSAMSDRGAADLLSSTNPNLTWEQTVGKYAKDGRVGDDLWRAIIDASQRSNAEVNRLLGQAIANGVKQ